MDSGDIKLIELGSYVRPEVKEYYGKDWVLNGENNSYPQYVIDRRIGSPTNGAIIEVFCELMYGKGLAIGDDDEVYKDLVEIFPKREQRKCLADLKTFGYYFMQILRSKGTEKKIAKILHLPVEKMGRDKMDEEGDINGAWYCEDWTSIHKNKPEFIPEFKGELTDSRMVKSVVPHQQGQTYFSLPSYVQGLQYAEMEEEISNYCINHIKNGLSFGYIINFNNGAALNKEQKDAVETMIKEKLTGSSNAGKFILSFNDSKDVEVTVVPLEVSDAHSQWEFLTKLSSEKIVTSHGAFPALFGLQTSSGFSSNADELDVQSKLVQDYQINPKQSFFIDELAELLKVNNLNTDLNFIPLRDGYNSTEDEDEEVLDDVVDENELEEEDLRLSEHICLNTNNADFLINLGEDVDENEWDLLDDRRCDKITLSETQLNLVIELAQTPKTSKKNSEQDTSLFKIRYKYAGASTGERDFCRKVLESSKVYRAEDLDANYNYNEDFAPEGKSSYNIFNFKGGVNCQHFWQRVIFLKKGNDKISVNKARKMILALEPDERQEAKWEQNDKRVAKVAEPQNNWWSLKPNYRK
tara:strand:+ start:11766 stop:13508 length:1743 start_codon:yes stop_codon:yes gene_type:complete